MADTRACVLLGTEDRPEPRQVDAWFTETPGLIITRSQDIGDTFVLTHVPSGRSVGPYVYLSIEAAQRTGLALGGILEWWRHDGFYNSLPEPELEQVKAVCKREGTHWFGAKGGAS